MQLRMPDPLRIFPPSTLFHKRNPVPQEGRKMAEKAIDFRISKVWLVGIATILTALFIGLAGTGSAQAARVDCGTFTVLHNDRIKSVRFPKGAYDISANKLSCKQAIKLFQQFLKDPDMILRAPWVVNKNRKFARGKGSRVNFTATPVNGPGPGPSPSPGSHVRCPATFKVLHNDMINTLSVPKGTYRVTLLQQTGMTCAQTTTYMQQFLAAAGNKLPSPWILHKSVPSFIKGKGGPGFKIKRISA